MGLDLPAPIPSLENRQVLGRFGLLPCLLEDVSFHLK